MHCFTSFVKKKLLLSEQFQTSQLLHDIEYVLFVVSLKCEVHVKSVILYIQKIVFSL